MSSIYFYDKIKGIMSLWLRIKMLSIKYKVFSPKTQMVWGGYWYLLKIKLRHLMLRTFLYANLKIR